MTELINTKLAGLYVALFCLSPFFVSAEQENIIEPISNDQNPKSFDCISYEKTGNLQAIIKSLDKKVKAGDAVHFTGEVLNNNSFPISSADIFIKIARKNPNGDIDIIDQFYAKKGINIKEVGNPVAIFPFDFTWNSPQSLPSGEYIIMSYVFVGNHFKMNGFEFSDDYSTNYNTFIVSSNIKEPAPYFDKASTVVNTNKYSSIGFRPELIDGEVVNISTVLVNESDAEKNILVEWKVFNGSILNEDNLIEKKIFNVLLKGGERKEITYSPTSSFFSNALVVGSAISTDSYSYINIPLKKLTTNYGNIKLAGLSNSFGDSLALNIFACYKMEDAKINDKLFFHIKVIDDKNSILFEDKSKISIFDSTISYSKLLPNFKFSKEDNLSLVAEIKDGENIIDSVLLDYSCDNFDCTNINESKSDTVNNNSKALPLIIITLLVIIVTTLYFINHKRGVNHLYKNKEENNNIK